MLIRFLAFAALFTMSCSLAPFEYRPLDAGRDRSDTLTVDVPTDLADATIGDTAPADVVSESTADVAPDTALDTPPDTALDTAPDAASDAASDVARDATDATPMDALEDVRADVSDAPDAADVTSVDAGPCGDAGAAVSVDAGVSPECPALPGCTSVVTAVPTGGAGTDGSPWTGWETIPAGACRVEFPPGVYHVRRPVTVRSNLTIRCLSSTSPVIFRRDPAMMTADGGVWSGAIFQETLGNELSNVVIDGCTFDHEGQYVDASDISFSGDRSRGIDDRFNLFVQNNHFINLDVSDSAVVSISSGTGPSGSGCFVVRNNEFISPRFGTRPNPTVGLPNAIYLTAGEHILVQGNRTQNHYGVRIVEGFYPSSTPVRDIQVVDNVFDQIKNEAVRISPMGNAIGRVDGGCGALADDTINGAYTGVRVDRNTVTVNDAVYGASINAGMITVSPRMHYYGCGGGSYCTRFHPMRAVSISDNALRGARFGIVMQLDGGGSVSCASGQEAGALVPYLARDVRVNNNTLDGSGVSGTVSTRNGEQLFLQGIRDLSLRGNRVLNSARGVVLSGENLQITGNTFQRLNQSSVVFDDAMTAGNLDVLGARFVHLYGPQFGESRDVTVACNAFTAPVTTGLPTLSAIFVDQGVSNATLANNTVTGTTYACAVAVGRGDAGVTDAGLLESDTTRVPSTIAARCP